MMMMRCKRDTWQYHDDDERNRQKNEIRIHNFFKNMNFIFFVVDNDDDDDGISFLEKKLSMKKI